MGNLPEVDESAVLARETLQGLYALGAETVHVVTDADGVVVSVQIAGEGGLREIALPPGSYLIARVVSHPTEHAGLFGVRAPRPARV
jgi:hypothetical protein